MWPKDRNIEALITWLREAGFLNPQISRYSVPIGTWSCSHSRPLAGLAALSSFLEYIDSSYLLLDESGQFTKDELIEFTNAVKQDLENLGNAIDEFLEVKVYVSRSVAPPTHY